MKVEKIRISRTSSILNEKLNQQAKTKKEEEIEQDLYWFENMLRIANLNQL